MCRDYLKIMREVKIHIDQSRGSVSNVSELAEQFKVSVRIFQEYFKYVVGKSPKEYIDDVRFQYLVDMMLEDGPNSQQIAFAYAIELGYQSGTGLNKLVRKKSGLTFLELQNNLFSDYYQNVFVSQSASEEDSDLDTHLDAYPDTFLDSHLSHSFD